MKHKNKFGNNNKISYLRSTKQSNMIKIIKKLKGEKFYLACIDQETGRAWISITAYEAQAEMQDGKWKQTETTSTITWIKINE